MSLFPRIFGSNSDNRSTSSSSFSSGSDSLTTDGDDDTASRISESEHQSVSSSHSPFADSSAQNPTAATSGRFVVRTGSKDHEFSYGRKELIKTRFEELGKALVDLKTSKLDPSRFAIVFQPAKDAKDRSVRLVQKDGNSTKTVVPNDEFLKILNNVDNLAVKIAYEALIEEVIESDTNETVEGKLTKEAKRLPENEKVNVSVEVKPREDKYTLKLDSDVQECELTSELKTERQKLVKGHALYPFHEYLDKPKREPEVIISNIEDELVSSEALITSDSSSKGRGNDSSTESVSSKEPKDTAGDIIRRKYQALCKKPVGRINPPKELSNLKSDKFINAPINTADPQFDNFSELTEDFNAEEYSLDRLDDSTITSSTSSVASKKSRGRYSKNFAQRYQNFYGKPFIEKNRTNEVGDLEDDNSRESVDSRKNEHWYERGEASNVSSNSLDDNDDLDSLFTESHKVTVVKDEAALYTELSNVEITGRKHPTKTVAARKNDHFGIDYSSLHSDGSIREYTVPCEPRNHSQYDDSDHYSLDSFLQEEDNGTSSIETKISKKPEDLKLPPIFIQKTVENIAADEKFKEALDSLLNTERKKKVVKKESKASIQRLSSDLIKPLSERQRRVIVNQAQPVVSSTPQNQVVVEVKNISPFSTIATTTNSSNTASPFNGLEKEMKEYEKISTDDESSVGINEDIQLIQGSEIEEVPEKTVLDLTWEAMNEALDTYIADLKAGLLSTAAEDKFSQALEALGESCKVVLMLLNPDKDSVSDFNWFDKAEMWKEKMDRVKALSDGKFKELEAENQNAEISAMQNADLEFRINEFNIAQQNLRSHFANQDVGNYSKEYCKQFTEKSKELSREFANAQKKLEELHPPTSVDESQFSVSVENKQKEWFPALTTSEGTSPFSQPNNLLEEKTKLKQENACKEVERIMQGTKDSAEVSLVLNGLINEVERRSVLKEANSTGGSKISENTQKTSNVLSQKELTIEELLNTATQKCVRAALKGTLSEELTLAYSEAKERYASESIKGIKKEYDNKENRQYLDSVLNGVLESCDAQIEAAMRACNRSLLENPNGVAQKASNASLLKKTPPSTSETKKTIPTLIQLERSLNECKDRCVEAALKGTLSKELTLAYSEAKDAYTSKQTRFRECALEPNKTLLLNRVQEKLKLYDKKIEDAKAEFHRKQTTTKLYRSPK